MQDKINEFNSDPDRVTRDLDMRIERARAAVIHAAEELDRLRKELARLSKMRADIQVDQYSNSVRALDKGALDPDNELALAQSYGFALPVIDRLLVKLSPDDAMAMLMQAGEHDLECRCESCQLFYWGMEHDPLDPEGVVINRIADRIIDDEQTMTDEQWFALVNNMWHAAAEDLVADGWEMEDREPFPIFHKGEDRCYLARKLGEPDWHPATFHLPPVATPE